MSHNKIRSLPASLSILQHLCILDVSFNNLTKLPKEIGQLTNLTIYFLPKEQDIILNRNEKLETELFEIKQEVSRKNDIETPLDEKKSPSDDISNSLESEITKA